MTNGGTNVGVFNHKGNFENLEKFFGRIKARNYIHILDKYGEEGVQALAAYTPKDSGKTADSWSYKIDIYKHDIIISWYNSSFNEGVPIAIILQYGHVTNNDGYVQGIDYINPALRPIFNSIRDSAWKEVTEA